MSDQERFRFVVVGSGNISRTYVDAVAALGDAEIVGIVSRSGGRPDNAKGSPVYPSIEAAAEALPFDAVILCTPNGLHHEAAAAAAACGKHVLTEKVLDITRANMDAMDLACASAGVVLAVAFQRRMSPDNRAVKTLLDARSLGRVYAADMRVKFYRDMGYYDSAGYRGGYEIDGGGPFIQQAAHNVDVFSWFFGMPEEVVSMLGTLRWEIEVEDHGVAAMRYADGMIGSIIASTVCGPRGYPPVLEIHAEKGSITMVNDEITSWEIDGIGNPSSRDGFAVHSGADSAAVSDTSGHQAIIADFVRAVRTGCEPAVPAAQGRMATELVLQIYEAGGRKTAD